MDAGTMRQLATVRVPTITSMAADLSSRGFRERQVAVEVERLRAKAVRLQARAARCRLGSNERAKCEKRAAGLIAQAAVIEASI